MSVHEVYAATGLFFLCLTLFILMIMELSERNRYKEDERRHFPWLRSLFKHISTTGLVLWCLITTSVAISSFLVGLEAWTRWRRPMAAKADFDEAVRAEFETAKPDPIPTAAP